MASGVESKGEEPTAKEKTLVKKAIALFDTFCNGRQCLDDFIKDASEDLEVSHLVLGWLRWIFNFINLTQKL